jgi:hypothetical protein
MFEDIQFTIEWNVILRGLYVRILWILNYRIKYKPTVAFVFCFLFSVSFLVNRSRNSRNLFCVQWVKVRGDCSFCWYWWSCWLSLNKLYFHQVILSSDRRENTFNSEWNGVVGKNITLYMCLLAISDMIHQRFESHVIKTKRYIWTYSS